jgi:ribosomal protein S18 acetylase RimI-like enzyme
VRSLGAGGLPPGLLARLDDLWFENYAAWARANPRGWVEDLAGWRVACLGSTWPFYNIATPRVGETVQVDTLRNTLPPGGYRVWVRDGMDDAEDALVGAGFNTELELPAYLLDLEAAAPLAKGRPLPDGYSVSRAESKSEIEECVWGDRLSPWLDVAGVKAAFPDPYRMAQAADRRFCQARFEDRLVGTGQSLVHHGVAGVYTMWTAEPHRGRGLASAMLRLLCSDLAAAGATEVTLQSTAPDGGLYARAGFKPCFAYRVYGEPHEVVA